MADPTQKNRQAIKDGIRAVIPGSPLGQSLSKSAEEEAAQIAADEANNLVLQRDPVSLPEEAQNFTNPEVVAQNSPQSVSQESFVNPSQAQDAQRAPATGVEQPSAPSVSSQIPDQSSQYDQAFNAYEKEADTVQTQLDEVNRQRTEAIQKRIEEDEKTVEKIKPPELFAGKSTWQKVLGGIGMFLGSLTPEGAKNIANMIDKEIERDIEMQRSNIKLKQDKNDRHYQNLLQKYGSQEAALLAKKKDAYTAMGAHVKKLELAARNAETRARLGQGAQEIELKKQSLNQQLSVAMMKQMQEAQKGAVPGYSGSISDPTAAREFRNQVTSAQSAFSEIDNLLTINKKGISSSFSPSDRASAQQSQTLLQGQLREALVGPGAVSEGERALLKEAIANPTNFFSLGSSNELKLNKLKQALRNKIDANAKAYGLQKVIPQGARKM